MKKCIALLRGINVGGKNKVSMKELKELLKENGFQDVDTYINSGNIIFSGDNYDENSGSVVNTKFSEIIVNQIFTYF